MAGTPQEIARKWAQNLSASSAEMERGARAVRTAPGMLAAERQDKMRANILRAIDSGKWARNVSSVSLAEWQNAYIQKAITRAAQGAQAAEPKMAQFMGRLLPYQDNLKTQLATMPDLTIEDSINRAAAWIRGMANFENS